MEAGTDILFAPTFTASRIKLEEYGLENSLVQMNRELVALSKRAAGGRAYVAGDLTMTGRQLYPAPAIRYLEDLRKCMGEQRGDLGGAERCGDMMSSGSPRLRLLLSGE